MTRATIIVSGEVQGVFFRRFAREEADDLGITGFARNQPDGSVYIEADGYDARLKEFVERMREGAPGSSVSFVSVSYEARKEEPYPEFSIE